MRSSRFLIGLLPRSYISLGLGRHKRGMLRPLCFLSSWPFLLCRAYFSCLNVKPHYLMCVFCPILCSEQEHGKDPWEEYSISDPSNKPTIEFIQSFFFETKSYYIVQAAIELTSLPRPALKL